MVNDPVSNLIISLKNASLQSKEAVRVPYTKMSLSILEVLKKEGYVKDVTKHGKDIKKHIDVDLQYAEDGTSKIVNVKRVSKFSTRVYKGFKDIKPVKSGYGIQVLSTPAGIMSGRSAIKQNVGGEVLFEIW